MYVIWRDRENKLHRILCMNYKVARQIYEQIKDFNVKEISKDQYGCACGLYDIAKMRQMVTCC